MVQILCVAEKPSLAKSIASGIATGQIDTIKNGGNPPIHSFDATFNGSKARYHVTAVTGHMYSLDFDPRYRNWDAVDPLILYDAKTHKIPVKSSICHHIQNASRNIDIIILFLDCDKEGENICFEVLENSRRFLNPSHRIYRAHFSSVSPSDIKHALSNLRQPNINQSLSVDVRQEFDLRIGASFTRFQTKFFSSRYGNLNSILISYGPCQTPTLGFIVERVDIINSFTPEKFFSLKATIQHGGSNIELGWKYSKIFDSSIVRLFHKLLSSREIVDNAKLISFSSKEKKRVRPLPLNTVELLKVASSRLHIGSGETMHHAESLYINGFITYPRTESSIYPKSFSPNTLVSLFLNSNSEFNSIANEVASLGINGGRHGVDMGDHPPITPLRVAKDGELSGNEYRLYSYIVLHFLASVASDAVMQSDTLKILIGGQEFTAHSSRLVSPGYMNVLGKSHEKEDDDTLSSSALDFDSHLPFKVTEIFITEGTTSPPNNLTEAELIDRMQSHGIGTDASIPQHISNIIERNYARLDEHTRRISPTPLGMLLIHGYYQIDNQLVEPNMRAHVEKQLNLIATGEANSEEIRRYVLNIMRLKFFYFCKTIEKMNGLFSAHFSSISNVDAKTLSRCGKCHHWMRFISIKPQRLYCSNCDDSYDLPNGSIKSYMEQTCPLDSFDLVMNTIGDRTTILCPFCYNHPPSIEDANEKSEISSSLRHTFCNQCRNPSCKYSLLNSSVVECPECNGMLCIDVTSGPNWKIMCNFCNYLIYFAPKAHKVILTEDDCTRCNLCKLIYVNFHKDCSPIENKTEFTGCLMCDPELSNTISTKYGKSSLKHHSKRGRGRGRGRRGGRFKKNDNQDVRMSFDGF